MKKLFWQLFVSMLIITATSQVAIADVGKVIIAKGETYAIDTANNSRTLKRRSDILEGDTLITGDNSEIHIRFQDNAVLALRANSQLRINEYHAASGNTEEKVLMELLSGGFRTITGAFGKTDKEAYQIRTPNASIGIRGTNYEALLSNGNLLVGVYKGGVQLRNNSGTINLGMDSAFSFAEVGSANSAIQGLMEAPSELSKPLATSFKSPPAETEDSNSEATAEIQPDDEELLVGELFEGEQETLSPQTTPTARPTLSTLDTVKPTDPNETAISDIANQNDLAQFADVRLTQAQISQLKAGSPVGFVVVNENSDGYRLPVYTLTNDYSSAAETYTPTGASSFDITLKSDQSTITYTIDLSGLDSVSVFNEISSQLSGALGGEVNGLDVPSLVTVSLTDGRLVFKGITTEDGAEIIIDNFQGPDSTTLAQDMGLCATTCTGSYNLGAPSVGNYDRATHFGYVVSGKDGPVFVNYENDSIYVLQNGYKAPDNVFRGNADAQNTQFASLDPNGDGSTVIDWGYWNASATTPSILLKDPKSLMNAEKVEAPHFYVVAPPAEKAQLSGQKSLYQMVAWHATASNQAGILDGSGEATLNSQIEVDFATGEAFGYLNLQNETDSWNWELQHYGQVNGAQYNSDWGYGTLSDSNTGYDVVGHVDGMFTTTDTGLGFAGGFGMQTTDEGTTHQAQGIFFIKE